MKNKLFLLPLVSGLVLFSQITGVLASSAPTLSQTINDGTQTIDIVDGSGNSVGSPAFNFSNLAFSFNSQTATGSLASSSSKIRVYNPTSDATWTVAIAATGGAGAVWTSGSDTYDFNDSDVTGLDDADSDAKGGKLSMDPSDSAVVGVPDNSTCSPTTGISKGSSASFQEEMSSVSSITLLTGAASATPYCRWDMTGISLDQVVPASQAAGNYSLGMTLTIL